MDELEIFIPTYREATTIRESIADFKRTFPSAKVIVYDGNSDDGTAKIAKEAGAVVWLQHSKGKGRAMQEIVALASAPIVLFVDGDYTYRAEDARQLVEAVASGKADMAVGNRFGFKEKGNPMRGMHVFGNWAINTAISVLFGTRVIDSLSGMRAIRRESFAAMPLVSAGFEIETEMTIKALSEGLRVVEKPIHYYSRPLGSKSKLNSVLDGWLILMTIFLLLKNTKPLLFFSSLGAVFMIVGIALGASVLSEYLKSGLVPRLPSAILSSLCILLAFGCFACGLIMDFLKTISSEQAQMLARLLGSRRAEKL